MSSLFRPGYAIRNLEHTHFLTMTVIDWLELFIRPQFADLLLDNLRYCIASKGLQVHGWCLMPNHLHMLATHPDGKLSDVLRDFKSYSAKQIYDYLQTGKTPESRKSILLDRFEFAGKKAGQGVKIWQDGNHPIECSSQQWFEQRLRYIHENPVKAGFVWEPDHYRYSSAVDYLTSRLGLLPLVKD